jgi:hypothetical protein
MNIDRFKQQHVQILQIIKHMRDLAHAGIQEHALEIARDVAALRSRVKAHLSIEDELLYPRIARHSNAQVSKLAQAYQEEMKPLSRIVLEFTARWSAAAQIQAEPEQFRAHANTAVKQLHKRIQHENTEFYPQVEQL